MKQWLALSALVASTAMADTGTWTRIGPEGGRLSAVAVDPDAPEIAYAVGEHHTFRRGPETAAWQRLPIDAGFSLAVADGGRVYVGGIGRVFRSNDHGASFATVDLPADGIVEILAVDPSDAGRIYAVSTHVAAEPGASASTLLVGTEDGARWTAVGDLPLNVTALAVQPDDPSRLYLGVVGQPVLVSADSGRTWTPTAESPPCPGIDQSGELQGCVEALLARPDALLIGTVADGILRSADQGATWQRVSAAAYVESLVPVSTASDVLYAAGTTAWPGLGRDAGVRGLVLRSDDGGASWQTLDGTTPAPIAMVASGDGERLYAATGSRHGFAGHGLYASSDSGASWQLDQAGLDASCVISLVAAASPMSTLHAALGNDTLTLAATRDGGSTWEVAAVDPHPFVAALAGDRNDPQHLVAAAHFDGLFVSRDGGATWEQRPLDGDLVLDVALDAVDGEALYIVGPDGGLAKSDDDGATIRLVLRGDWGIRNVAVDEASGAVFATSDQAVHASYDGGATWERIFESNTEAFTIGSVTVAPTAPPTLYVVSTAGLQVSDDGGRRWRLVSFPGPQESYPATVAIDPSRAPTAYVVAYTASGESQVFRTDDAGRHWRAVGEPPPNAARVLAVDPHDRRVIYAGTCGGGVQMLVQSPGGGGDHDGCAVVPPVAGAGLLAAHGLAIGLLALLRRRLPR